MYWNTVLNEVLNKHNKSYQFIFTNFSEDRERLNEEEEKKKSPILKNRAREKSYALGSKYPGVCFTPREVDCMMGFMLGKTIVQVAKILHLSPRTVEFYLNNMKRKLSCRTKSELIIKVMDSDLRKKIIVFQQT